MLHCACIFWRNIMALTSEIIFVLILTLQGMGKKRIIYAKASAHINVNPVGGGGGRDSIGGLMTKLIPSLRHFLTCPYPGWGGLNSAQPARRLNLLMRMSSDA
jgi:hypothetical protein